MILMIQNVQNVVKCWSSGMKREVYCLINVHVGQNSLGSARNAYVGILKGGCWEGEIMEIGPETGRSF